ncbi:MAG: DUF4157 domain-containing protein [Kofleriaceae bacterium]
MTREYVRIEPATAAKQRDSEPSLEDELEERARSARRRPAPGKLTRTEEPSSPTPAAPAKLVRAGRERELTPAQALAYARWLSEGRGWSQTEHADAERPQHRGAADPRRGALATAFSFLADTKTPRPALAGPLAMRSAEAGAAADAEESSPLERALQRSAGVPLPSEVRAQLEQLLGASFADVRIHLDSEAAAAASAIKARAFTIADHIFFRPGAFAPETAEGRELLAHELTHVLQWRAGRVPTAPTPQTSDPRDGLEREAEDVGRQVAARASAPPPAEGRARRPARVAMPSWSGAAPAHPGPAREDAHEASAVVPSAAAPSALRLDDALLRPDDPYARVDKIPEGGVKVDKLGVVAWDGAPALQLRPVAGGAVDKPSTSLSFGAKVRVLRQLAAEYFVSTTDGSLGYVAKTHVKVDPPEPSATLHKVQGGRASYATAIAEQHYQPYADDWSRDARGYVEALADANEREVPDSAEGWQELSFVTDEVIWVPSPSYARGPAGNAESGAAPTRARAGGPRGAARGRATPRYGRW